MLAATTLVVGSSLGACQNILEEGALVRTQSSNSAFRVESIHII